MAETCSPNEVLGPVPASGIASSDNPAITERVPTHLSGRFLISEGTFTTRAQASVSSLPGLTPTIHTGTSYTYLAPSQPAIETAGRDSPWGCSTRVDTPISMVPRNEQWNNSTYSFLKRRGEQLKRFFGKQAWDSRDANLPEIASSAPTRGISIVSWTQKLPFKRGRIDTTYDFENGFPVGVMSHNTFRKIIQEDVTLSNVNIESISWWRRNTFLRHQYFIVTVTYRPAPSQTGLTACDSASSPPLPPVRYDLIFERAGKMNKVFGHGGVARQRVTTRASEPHDSFGRRHDILIVALAQNLQDISSHCSQDIVSELPPRICTPSIFGQILGVSPPSWNLSTCNHETDQQHRVSSRSRQASLADIVKYMDSIIKHAPYYKLFSLNCYFFARTCFLLIALNHYTFDNVIVSTTNHASEPGINRLVYELDCDRYNWGRKRWWIVRTLCVPILSACLVATLSGAIRDFKEPSIEWSSIGVFLFMNLSLLALVTNRAVQVSSATKHVFESLGDSVMTCFSPPVKHVYFPARLAHSWSQFVERCAHNLSNPFLRLHSYSNAPCGIKEGVALNTV